MPERKLMLLTRLPWLPARSVTLREPWPENCRLISTSQVNRVSFLCWEQLGHELSLSSPLCMYVFIYITESFIHEQDLCFTPALPQTPPVSPPKFTTSSIIIIVHV